MLKSGELLRDQDNSRPSNVKRTTAQGSDHMCVSSAADSTESREALRSVDEREREIKERRGVRGSGRKESLSVLLPLYFDACEGGGGADEDHGALGLGNSQTSPGWR